MPRLLALSLFAFTATGCLQIRYLAQATRGQMDLLSRAEPIPIALHKGVPPHVQEVLRQVKPIKAWAQTRGLTPSKSYEKYAELERAAAVWVVQAAPRLSFQPKTWWFPIVGSVPYLGYFHEDSAHAFADKLAASEPLDVEVRGASAYSTLGFMDDPVLSTMIDSGPEAMGDFANTLLHESVHATVYVGGQSAFNESLASFVADRLTKDWLVETWGESDVKTTSWLSAEDWRAERMTKLIAARKELEALYASSRTDEEKLKEKARIYGELASALHTKRTFNNATLAGLQTYSTGTEAFGRLYEACGKNWSRFLHAVSTLEKDDFPSAQAREFDSTIDVLVTRGCP